MAPRNELSIIIVNWNGKDVLPACLRSVAENPPSVDYRVIVVDNASTDESRQWLASGEAAKLFPEGCFEVILNDENVGFGRANNQAMRAFPSDYYFLLNSDAEVLGKAIDVLLETAKEDKNIGAVGPKLLNTDGSLQPCVWRNPPSAWEFPVNVLRLYKFMPRRVRGNLLLGSFWDHNEKRDVKLIFGAAMLLSSNAFRVTKGFDESFQMYSEDLDLCLRIVKSNLRIVFVPNAEVIHHGGKSSFVRWEQVEKATFQTTSFLYFQQKHLSRGALVANCVSAIISFNIERLWRKMRSRPTTDLDVQISVYKNALGKHIFGSAVRSK